MLLGYGGGLGTLHVNMVPILPLVVPFHQVCLLALLILALLLLILFEQGLIPVYCFIDLRLTGATPGTLLDGQVVVLEKMGPQLIGPPEEKLYSIPND